MAMSAALWRESDSLSRSPIWVSYHFFPLDERTHINFNLVKGIYESPTKRHMLIGPVALRDRFIAHGARTLTPHRAVIHVLHQVIERSGGEI
jgi:hypothetical protein